MAPENKPVLCYVTGGAALAADPPSRVRSLLRVIAGAAAAGVDWIQIREKDLPTRILLELARGAVEAAENSRARILVNDRLDVALAAAARGVHLGGESMPVAEVKKWCAAGNAPQDFLVGASCHSLAESQQAERDGADYLFFGPVFATPSKEPFGPPQGIAKLEEICRAVKIPVLAIGGMTRENAGECLRAGAAGVAAIRMFQEAADTAGLVRALHTKSELR